MRSLCTAVLAGVLLLALHASASGEPIRVHGAPVTGLAVSRALDGAAARERPELDVAVTNARRRQRAIDALCDGRADIAAFSTAMDERAMSACAGRGQQITEVHVSTSAVVFLRSPRSGVECLTSAQLRRLWVRDSPVETLGQVRSMRGSKRRRRVEFVRPAEVPLLPPEVSDNLFGREDLLRGGLEPVPLRKTGRRLRRSGSGFGIMGWTILRDSGASRLRLGVDFGSGCIEPTTQSIQAGFYEYDIPVFLYVRDQALTRPEVAAFLQFGIAEQPSFARSIQHVPLSPAQQLSARRAVEFSAARPPATLPAGTPGAGLPPVTIGTKDFTENVVLGELYAQALRSRGFTVNLRPSIGRTERIQPELQSGAIDLYPEYVGILNTVVAGYDTTPASAEAAYVLAAAYARDRGYPMLARSPFQNVDALIVRRRTARRYDLRTLYDLKRLGRFSLGGLDQFRDRFVGLVGLDVAYDLRPRFRVYDFGDQYRALDRRRVFAAHVFSTDGLLAARKYTLLGDPENVFGFQNVAPIVRAGTLAAQGPAFEQVLDYVTTGITTEAMRRMNADVDVRDVSPAEVARRYLVSRGVLAGP